MIFIFALFFLLLGFIGGMFTACGLTLDMLRACAKKGTTFIDKYRITFAHEENQE